jgi:hypothetical protein
MTNSTWNTQTEQELANMHNQEHELVVNQKNEDNHSRNASSMPITTEDYTNQKDDENPHNQEEELSSEDDSVVLYVDQKYCTICHVEQPLRAKHCKTCD